MNKVVPSNTHFLGLGGVTLVYLLKQDDSVDITEIFLSIKRYILRNTLTIEPLKKEVKVSDLKAELINSVNFDRKYISASIINPREPKEKWRCQIVNNHDEAKDVDGDGNIMISWSLSEGELQALENYVKVFKYSLKGNEKLAFDKLIKMFHQ